MPATLELEEEEGGEEGEEESEIPLGMKWIGCRMDGHKKQREVLVSRRWGIDGKCPWA